MATREPPRGGRHAVTTPLTALHAAPAAPSLRLAGLVVSERGRSPLGSGDGCNHASRRAITTHRVGVDWLPPARWFVAGSNGAHEPLLHGLAATPLSARILHALRLFRGGAPSFGRFAGTPLTWLALLAPTPVRLVVAPA